MIDSKNFPLSHEQKLFLLRRCDCWRKWTSLDDKRHCVLCDRIFSGRNVRITFDKTGRATAHCPTRGCTSTCREWLYPGDPLLDERAWEDWLRLLKETEGERFADDDVAHPEKHPSHHGAASPQSVALNQ